MVIGMRRQESYEHRARKYKTKVIVIQLIKPEIGIETRNVNGTGDNRV